MFYKKYLFFLTARIITYLGGEEMLDKIKECSENFYNFATPISPIIVASIAYKATVNKPKRNKKR